jgi:hypothetical protein
MAFPSNIFFQELSHVKNTTKIALLIFALSISISAFWLPRSDGPTTAASLGSPTASMDRSEPRSEPREPQSSDHAGEMHPGINASPKDSTSNVSSATQSEEPPSPQTIWQIGPKFETYTVNSEGGIGMDAARSILESDVFDAQAEHYARQAAADPDTAVLTKAYSAFIREVIARHRLRLRLKSLACGSKQCIGALSDGSLDEYERWSLTIGKDRKLPHYTRVESIVGGPGSPELRFIFALDSSRGIR